MEPPRQRSGHAVRARPGGPILQERPDPMLRRNMEAYVQEHDLRGLVGEMSLMMHMPQDPRRFLAAELGRQLQQPADDRDELSALPRDSFVLSLHASAGHGREGAGGRAPRWQRVLWMAPSGRMARYQAERELTEQLRAVIWGGGAGGGEHHAEPQAVPSASLPVPDRAPPAIPHALVLALSGLDDVGLRREFGAHADLVTKGERRLSKVGLASLMRDKGIAHSEDEVGRVLERVDVSKDGVIDFSEFCAFARANSDLEKVLRSKHLERVLCSFIPSGTTLEDFAAMSREQISDIVELSKEAQVQLLVDLAAQMKVVGTAQHAAGGGKFSGELRGGTLDNFYEGVTGVCGDPDADLEEGMRSEHTERPDSHVEFSTPNYGLTTTPSQEWKVVLEGGSGCLATVAGTRGCCKGGQTQEDVRVVRQLAHYGDFGEDGRLTHPRPCDSDTPIQRRVKLARLRRCEIYALVLYTGPMFVLYNAILRGFGSCGAVAAGIEFESTEFWDQFNAKKIDVWVEGSGHKFTNTIHALASAIKKLQGLAAQEPSTLLYRGLGGLDVAKFAASCGFTDLAFMSTTKDRRIALEYSGVNKGLVGTVLCIETSTTNNGAVIAEFSQYPGEEETVWNACSFLQQLPGREEVELLPEGGVVRVYHVLVSANSRAETVEELEGRRKRVVVQVLDTLHADVCRAVDAAAATEEFEARIAQDKEPDYTDEFIASIKDESTARVAVYKALPDGAYADIETLGEAVSKGLALPLLALAKLRLWLEDPSLDLYTMSDNDSMNTNYLGLNAAQGRRLAQRRLRLQHSAPWRRGSIDRVGRIVVEDGLGRMGDTATAALALEDCRERRLVTGAGAAALERRDLFTSETPLITQIQLGESENAKRLLQAGADANAATAGGERALLMAAKEGRDDLVKLLADFQAEVNGRDAEGRTALHWASKAGNTYMVQVLLELGADVKAKNKASLGWTSLHWASYHGHYAVVQTLLEHGADIEARSKDQKTSLHMASERGHAAVVQTLLKHGADIAARGTGDLCQSTSLHLASQHGHTAVVQTLLKHRADVEARDDFEKSSLHRASFHGHATVVQTLLEHGADAAARDKYGKTPLDRANKDEVERVFARHSLLFAAQVGMVELVAEHIAQGAELAARDDRGRTALLLACAHGHEAAAARLVAPTHAAGALDAVGVDGFSALLWAEERKLDGVAQGLRECGAAAVRRPALALFCGEWGVVHVDVGARTVAFSGNKYATVRSTQRCPLGSKGYYELEILQRDGVDPQYGFAAAAFARVLGAKSGEGVGDDAHSWAVDGARQLKWYKGEEEDYKCEQWKDSDIIGLACDMDAMHMHVSLNGSFAAPHGIVFDLAADTVGDGLFAAFSGSHGKVRYNLGEVPFRHAPPAVDFQAFAEFEC